MGAVLFSIFINDLVRSSAPSASLQTTPSLVVQFDAPEGQDAIQRDLDKLEKWAYVNLMRFSKAKCKVLHLSWGNPKHKEILGDEGIERSPAEDDLGYWWTKSWS